MRILLVNTSERTGGAAIAANRLMKALHLIGVDTKMLVRDKTTNNSNVIALPRSPFLKAKFVAERAEIFFENNFRRHNLFKVDHATHGTDITCLEAFKNADIVHLHWVNQGMLSLADIQKILASGKPLVWTMHDMWVFTGICHYAHDCQQWLSGCGNCPLLYDGTTNDLSRRTFVRKTTTYDTGTMHLVGCSDWLATLALKAPLLHNHVIHSIPNPIDTHFYAPSDMTIAREELGLPQTKHILLFVAYKATDPIKGIRYLQEAVAQLVAIRPEYANELHIVVVGREASLLQNSFACPVSTFEYISDETTMRTLYTAATLLCMPTTSDNLPNTIVEAMACGLPVVGFRVGGLPQMIDSEQNGYLAKERDTTDFATGIRLCLSHGARKTFPLAARQKSLRHYSEEAVATKMLSVYRQALHLEPTLHRPEKE